MFADADMAVSARPVTMTGGRPDLVVPVVHPCMATLDATGRVFPKHKNPLRAEHKKDT